MSTLNVSNISDGTDTVATGYVVNGSAKAWVNSTQVGTHTSRDSLNVSSLTDLGTGRTRITLSSAMNNNDWAGSFYTTASPLETSVNFNNDYAGGFGDKTTTKVDTCSYAASSAVDSAIHDVIIMGDLA